MVLELSLYFSGRPSWFSQWTWIVSGYQCDWQCFWSAVVYTSKKKNFQASRFADPNISSVSDQSFSSLLSNLDAQLILALKLAYSYSESPTLKHQFSALTKNC